MNKEVTDPVDDAAKHEVEKAVVEICGQAEKIIQLSGNAINFVQLGPNLVPHLLCRVAIFCGRPGTSRLGIFWTMTH